VPPHKPLSPRLTAPQQNIRYRDALNSKRALYTAFEQMQATSSGQPWFTGAANQGYTGLYGFGATQARPAPLPKLRQPDDSAGT